MKTYLPETPDGRAFHRVICEAPSDDSPRLIFADWLEESGHPERAEFILLQIRLHSLPPVDWSSRSGNTELLCLQRETETLLDSHREDWLWPLIDLGLSDKYHATFQRGFVNAIEIGGNNLVKYARAIFALHPVTQVALTIGGWGSRIGGRDTRRSARFVEFVAADLSRRGRREQRLPGPIFSYLERIGFPCRFEGARALVRACSGHEVVSRAAVAYGRDQAGLPPLVWPASPDD